ncbi:ATP-binding protein [Desulfobacterota bacterium AH_259_B03_O07]|nr:ATP-binding protein [Desulfobacterota bacterium AH_259_B03_O07]
MRQIGLRAEILFNILFLAAVAMLLIGIIAFIVTGRSAVQGKAEGVKSIIRVFNAIYTQEGDIKNGINFMKEVLGPGSWGVIVDKRNERIFFSNDSSQTLENTSDPRILEVMKTGDTLIDVEGINMPPFSFYKGFKIISPIMDSGRQVGVILLYQPLHSLEKEITSAQRIIAISILLNLVVIGVYGIYILSRRVVKPVHELIKATDDISRGKFPTNLHPGGVKEINQLQKALGNMYKEIENSKKSLKENIQALEESNRELVKTQKELIATEKLASLGKLGAGVAHEIGNPLSAIRGYVEILKKDYLKDDQKKEEFLDNIQKEVDRIDRIIRTLIDYSKPRDFELKEVDVNDVIMRSVDILNSQGLLKKTDLRLGLSDKPLTTKADYHQLSQVIINLLLNSKDAINEDGLIEIKSSQNHNGTIQISMSDNGCGIPEEIIDKIFDPFFTTKDPGKGTGLGLSVSERILQRFNANISAESKPGSGSTFTITLPAYRGQ